MSARLLVNEEPAAFEFVPGLDTSPFLLIADHASNRVPKVLGSLGLSGGELRSHIAWDIGIEATSRLLAKALGASLVLQRYSRLVIDCNRPLEEETSIVERSAGIEIPGNRRLSPEAIERRRDEVFRPYHDAIVAELARRQLARLPCIFVAMHSFTPVFMGHPRPWHVGVLYQRDCRLARPVLAGLRGDTSLVVGDNQPYAVSNTSDYSIIEYGERRSNVHVELEIRQDLISDVHGQRAWAKRLHGVLVDSANRLGLLT